MGGYMLGHPYCEIPGFSEVYFEDSWVTGFSEDANRILFVLDLVLCEGHPLYQQPKIDEQYCYRRAELEFPDVKQVVWHERHFAPAIDASHEIDYGNIDAFQWKDGQYYLEGDWGKVTIESSLPCISYRAR